MDTPPRLNKTPATIDGEIPFHQGVGEQPYLLEPEDRRPFVGECHELESVALALMIRPHRQAVEKQMVRPDLDYREPDFLSASLDQPDLAAQYPRLVVLARRQWHEADLVLVGAVCICGYMPDRIDIPDVRQSYAEALRHLPTQPAKP